jgi:hypothetical protein
VLWLELVLFVFLVANSLFVFSMANGLFGVDLLESDEFLFGLYYSFFLLEFEFLYFCLDFCQVQ